MLASTLEAKMTAEAGPHRPVLLRETVDLLRTSVATGVRIDRHDLDRWIRAQREDDGRASPERADLDDPATLGTTRGCVEELPGLGLGQPPVDMCHGRPRGLERHHV